IRVDFTRQFANRIDEEVGAAFAALHLVEIAVKFHGLDAAPKGEAEKIQIHKGVDALVLDGCAGSRVADIEPRLVDAQVLLRHGGAGPQDHQTQRPAQFHAACSPSRFSSKKADHSLSG